MFKSESDVPDSHREFIMPLLLMIFVVFTQGDDKYSFIEKMGVILTDYDRLSRKQKVCLTHISLKAAIIRGAKVSEIENDASNGIHFECVCGSKCALTSYTNFSIPTGMERKYWQVSRGHILPQEKIRLLDGTTFNCCFAQCHNVCEKNRGSDYLSTASVKDYRVIWQYAMHYDTITNCLRTAYIKCGIDPRAAFGALEKHLSRT